MAAPPEVRAPATASPRPTVSVIVPVFNGEAYLEQTLESVLRQTYAGPLEIMVVDDGSTDRTPEILAEYGGRIVAVHQENGGPSKARNTGIQKSQGEYIAFLDADDLWTDDKLEHQVRFLESHPAVDLVFADMMTFGDQGVILESYLRSITRKGFYARLLEEQHELKDPFQMLMVANFIPTGTVVLRRSCLRQSGLFDESISSVEDLDLWMRVSIHSKVGFVPRVLKKKREHGTNISKNLYRAICSAIYVREKLRDSFPALAQQYRRDFARRLAELYFGKGWALFDEGQMKGARQCFLRSFRNDRSRKALLYWLGAFLPVTVVRSIRKIRGRWRSPSAA